MATAVAAVLHARLDLILVRKIGLPFLSELAMDALVPFPCLDFSTVYRREGACRAEYILNRRLALDVYLDVLPLTSRKAVFSSRAAISTEAAFPYSE